MGYVKLFVLKALFLIVAASALAQPQAGSSLYSEVREAIDRREIAPTLLAKSVDSGDIDVLRLWGLMGEGACAAIRPYLEYSDAIKVKALEGLAHCGGTGAPDRPLELAANSENEEVRKAALEALGFIVPETHRHRHIDIVADTLLSNASDDIKASAIYGLMQNVTYAGLSPQDLRRLDLGRILEAAQKPGRLGFESAYFLIRLQGLGSVLSGPEVEKALAADVPVGQRYLLARLAGQLGSVMSDPLIALGRGHTSANADDRRVAVSAVRALGNLSDPQSRTFLMTLLLGADPEFRHLAIAALAARPDADAIVQQRLWDFVEDESPWVSVTALRSLVRLENPGVLDVAEHWLAGDDYYRAFVALGMLAQTDEGRAKLQAYAATHPDTVRGREAAIARDPSIEAATSPRDTPKRSLVQSYRSRQMVLQTSRGPVCILPSVEAPYAAANFMLLADSGKMDGMLWHRVIPGFVAQAGQSEDRSLANWGSIREEWSAEGHQPGTVGLATAGRDTGGTQFFINLENNRHLDGRYTVFGRVVQGMDVAYNLKEGDRIEKAWTAKADASVCN